MDYKKTYTGVEKADALRDLVRAAIVEQTEHRVNSYRIYYGKAAFENREFQTYHLGALLDALEKTDALLILGEMLKTEAYNG